MKPKMVSFSTVSVVPTTSPSTKNKHLENIHGMSKWGGNEWYGRLFPPSMHLFNFN